MADRRRQESPAQRVRSRRTEVTRNAIIDAARALFTEQGYAQTSVNAIADAAGVAVQTIYSTFGSKRGVLTALLERIDRSGIEPVAVRIAATSDPVEMLTLTASLERTTREQATDVLRVLLEAAAADPEIGEIWEAAFDHHRSGIASVCQALLDEGSLRSGLDLESAIATALAITSMEAYRELLDRRGWNHDDYERWLVETLHWALIGGPAPRPS